MSYLRTHSRFLTPPPCSKQELVLIGRKMDHAKMRAAFEEALVTIEELRAGPELWLTMEDPFPAWDDEEEEEYDPEQYML